MVTMMMKSARTAAATANRRSPLVNRLAVRSRSTLTGSAFTGPLQSHLTPSMSSTHSSNRIDTRNRNTVTTGTFASSSNCYGIQQVACCSSHAKGADTDTDTDTNTDTPKSVSSDDNDNNTIDNTAATSEIESIPDNSDSESKPYEIPGAQKGGRKLAIVFTCTVCDTRSAKQFTEQAYTNGVVLVRCPGCENLHLIADRLGYFQEENWDLESLVQQKGEKVRTVTDNDVWELTLEDLVGTEKMNRVLESVQEDDKDAEVQGTKDKDDAPSKA
jgi:protein import protein ZIM17